MRDAGGIKSRSWRCMKRNMKHRRSWLKSESKRNKKWKRFFCGNKKWKKILRKIFDRNFLMKLGKILRNFFQSLSIIFHNFLFHENFHNFSFEIFIISHSKFFFSDTSNFNQKFSDESQFSFKLFHNNFSSYLPAKNFELSIYPTFTFGSLKVT